MAQLPAASSAPSEDAVAIPTYEIRGERVVLDADLARLFGVETRRLNEQVRRNLTRFAGYAFPVDADARQDLMSQIATSNEGWGGRRKPPWVFTEHGVVMAATVLKSETAIVAMRHVVEVFVAARRRTPGSSGSALVPRLQRTLETLLDTVIDPRSQATVREEAQELLTLSIRHLKDRLGRPGLENEALAARAAKFLAEAEAAKAVAAKTRAEAGEIELRLLARKLRLVIEAERALAVDNVEAFLRVLADLSRS